MAIRLAAVIGAVGLLATPQRCPSNPQPFSLPTEADRLANPYSAFLRAGPLLAFQHDVDAAVRYARVGRSGFTDPYLAERRRIEPVLR
jgi:hypothetical protein